MATKKNDDSVDRTNQNGSKAEERGFPGYPHYPSKDDITNPESGNQKVSADVESLGNSRRLSPEAESEQRVRVNESVPEEDNDDLGIVSGTEADVTADDLVILGDKGSDQDLGEDETDSQRGGLDRVDEDIDEEESLDIPGGELDDDNEAIGEEDEENNYYSLGGDNHEAQEDDQQ